ncbi:hypothetical protein PC9H_009865 [Pleurotus ostreatus]|uniref:Cytochrome P450 n=1 Tax=Pleurotus ostreatus TaxID=5322 RepID=A0A8H7DR24_PLEOS|nr:uncharacterized protein PC9H_009865 [Pleurotus ostreatus]KAF7424558.1 hypothetical protein PC9H_009865 [Pleurotus ostreatus]
MTLVLAFTEALGLLATYLLFTTIYNKLSRKQPFPFPLPPSPPADPLIGHLRKIPLVHAEHTFVEWAKKYGEVTYLNILARHVVVLNSREAAYELLEKRGALHSDRPDMIVWDIMGWGNALTFLHYGDRFRRQRKLMNSHLSAKACTQYKPMQLENAHLLVGHLMEAKGEYAHALTHFSTAIIMRITYGHQISSDGDEYVVLAANAQASGEESGVPGGTPIDYFPILQYLPSWFPGTHYAYVARKWQNHVQRFRNIPFEYVVTQMAEGTSKPSFLSNMLGRFNGRTLSDEEREDLKDAAAVMYSAGAGTTSAILGLFFMAMLENPECQKLAQDEIDRVVGKDRLPTFEDRASLVYVECLVQELFRWNPIIPLGLMHRSIEDDVYKGMFIPKGSLIYPNVLAMSLDENYSDPTAFNPSRFMPKLDGGGGEPPFPSAFGFGRRICPGRHLAYASVWIAVATILSTLNITRKKDKEGNDIPFHLEFASGITK